MSQKEVLSGGKVTLVSLVYLSSRQKLLRFLEGILTLPVFGVSEEVKWFVSGLCGAGD